MKMKMYDALEIEKKSPNDRNWKECEAKIISVQVRAVIIGEGRGRGVRKGSRES
jgi:hypothetical protein